MSSFHWKETSRVLSSSLEGWLFTLICIFAFNNNLVSFALFKEKACPLSS